MTALPAASLFWNESDFIIASWYLIITYACFDVGLTTFFIRK